MAMNVESIILQEELTSKQLEALTHSELQSLLHVVLCKKEALEYLKKPFDMALLIQEIWTLDHKQDDKQDVGICQWRRYLQAQVNRNDTSERHKVIRLLYEIDYRSMTYSYFSEMRAHHGDASWIREQETKLNAFEKSLRSKYK
jgi:CTP:phosphocholine cytidylyltransferase-like protein